MGNRGVLRRWWTAAVGTTLILVSCTAWAAYVTDEFEITLRTGPSTSHRIVAMLRSGQEVQVLQKNDAGWAFVRVLDGPAKDKEGWVINRYLMERVPWEKQAAQLRQENTAIKSSLTESDSQWLRYQTREKELTETLEKTSRELEALKKEHQVLREGAADYLKLKEEFERTQAALAESQALAKRLAQENESLRVSQNIRWFIIGALVLLCGWIIGLVMGRQRRKKSGGLHFS
ncbi:TIGR04211 family SH3 domain-containing protein [Desulfosoma caldarium]|uniref:SH3 domain protein n=1 Tax=Desulfosoma caldarium TaxID=610254 RepID=A0A3N1UJQ4_9BACT|nr:TIGR04211 family SH3 domain-containing protein [Desulfosoma caldarium]ROQ89599.1 SH3 domain protein [Desulfosoma caldarium]